MMASFGSYGLPGVLHYCLLPLIKYLVSQLLAAQQRLDHTGSAGQDRGKKVEEKKRSRGRGNELLESSCFGCCFCFPALCSAVSPVFITFNIMVVFTIHFPLVSSSPSLKPATSWERASTVDGLVPFLPPPKPVFFPEKLVQIANQKDEILPRLHFGNVSGSPVNCQHCEHTAYLQISSSRLAFSQKLFPASC